MRQYIIILTVLLISSTGFINAQHSAKDRIEYPDTLLTIPNIRTMATKNPDEALNMLDQSEEKNLIAKYKINWTRAQIYGGFKRMGRMALKYGVLVLKDDSVRNNPKNYTNMCHNIIEQLIYFKRYEKALEYADEMMKVAGNDKELLSRVTHDSFWSIASVNRNRGDRDKAYEYIDKAIKASERSQLPELRKINDQIKYSKLKLSWLFEDNKHNDALKAAQHLFTLTEKLRPYIGESFSDKVPEKVFQEKEAIAISMLAQAYYNAGQIKKAKDTFKRVENSKIYNKNELDDAVYDVINYLITAKENDKAIELTLPIVDPKIYRDTINSARLDACRILSKLYSENGNIKEANKYVTTALILSDSIYQRENEDEALELATIFETNDKERMIKAQAESLKRHEITTYFALAMLALATIIIALVSRHSRAIAKKNRLMAKQIENSLAYKEELLAAQERIYLLNEKVNSINANNCPKDETVNIEEESVNTEKESIDSSISNEDKKCFEELDMMLRGKKLYLDPDLTRDKILHLININKNKLSPMIQASTGENMNGYINGLRLEYALKLLKTHSNYTIEAIAIDSGFNNIRTFQRLFRSKYGMSPIEFRKSLD